MPYLATVNGGMKHLAQFFVNIAAFFSLLEPPPRGTPASVKPWPVPGVDYRAIVSQRKTILWLLWTTISISILTVGLGQWGGVVIGVAAFGMGWKIQSDRGMDYTEKPAQEPSPSEPE